MATPKRKYAPGKSARQIERVRKCHLIACKMMGGDTHARWRERYMHFRSEGSTPEQAIGKACTEVPIPVAYLDAARKQINQQIKQCGYVRLKGIGEKVIADPGASQPEQAYIGVQWLDWVFANWGTPLDKLQAAAPGLVYQLQYYRANEKEFRHLWVEEWRRGLEAGRTPSKGKKAEPEQPENDQDRELKETLADLRNGAK